MAFTLRQVGTVSLAVTMISTILSTDGSGASARELDPQLVRIEPSQTFQTEPLQTQNSDAPQTGENVAAAPSAPEVTSSQAVPALPEIAPATLAALVSAQPQPAELSRELNCLAGAVYFEAKSESLAGQLAVGRVVIARSRSGRFPSSYCGVVYQRSQFSFVRGNSMPSLDHGSRQWRNAVAIAQIAHADAWHSPVEGALFFHAARVSPNWRLTKVARIDNHVFYR